MDVAVRMPVLRDNADNDNDITTLGNDDKKKVYHYLSHTKKLKKLKKLKKKGRGGEETPHIATSKLFLVLLALLFLAAAIQFVIVFSWHHSRHDQDVLGHLSPETNPASNYPDNYPDNPDSSDDSKRHLHPFLPPLPPFSTVENSSDLISQLLRQHRPTIAGIAALLSNFLSDLHDSNRQLASWRPPHRAQRDDVHAAFVQLATRHLKPFEDAYRHQLIFPVRTDDSLFVSLASFRDHLLADTLMGAFHQADRPENLFVGVIVQNCFFNQTKQANNNTHTNTHPNNYNPHNYDTPDAPGEVCKTGRQVIGKDPHGHDLTRVSDAPPDRNGIAEFCSLPQYSTICNNGHLRVLYLHENESLGPAMARYYASKLWGGETYFMQVDSHLQFAPHWDTLYIQELHATKSYPKSVLSSYPPGFTESNNGILPNPPSPGARLCQCEFSTSDVESQILRINTASNYHGHETHPTQIPFIAAGFFFAHATFLQDVPFDPYLPWCFMGEEILLSMRAWTSGWDIYAPRYNLIAHQYRPGRMGLPKFWGSVGRLFGRPGPGFSNQLQLKLIQRVKYLVGYDECSKERIQKEGNENVLHDIQYYGFGSNRTREEYLKFANIDVKNKKCHSIPWCIHGTLE